MSDIEVKHGHKLIAMPEQVSDDAKRVLREVYDEVMSGKLKLNEILIIGVDENGHLVWSGSSNKLDALWMVEALKHKVLFGKEGDK